MPRATRNELFRRLSEALTGEPRLVPALSDRYLALITKAVGKSQVEAIISAFRDIDVSTDELEAELRSRILNDATLGPLAVSIILLWYTGVLTPPGGNPPTNVDDPADHFNALIWPIVGAHAPGLSGGYFGHWAYPTEN